MNTSLRLFPRLFLLLLMLALHPASVLAHNTGKPHREYTAKELRELGLEDLIADGQAVSLAPPVSAEEIWSTWAFDPGVVITLLLLASFYVVGTARLWRATHVGAGISRLEALSYAASWAILAAALVSPLHPWGEVLFSAHMTQHEILMLIVAPLMVLGRPLIVYLWALPLSWRKKVAATFARPRLNRPLHFIADPFVAWALHAIILWAWHIPAWFEATLGSDIIHTLQHASFLGSALLFWWAVFFGRRRVLGYGMAVFYLFTTAVHSGALGALLVFTSVPWYPAYAQTAQAWGMTALEDQQLGGLIMWVPAGVVYIASALVLFARWMAESERRVRLEESLSWQTPLATTNPSPAAVSRRD